MKRILFVPGIEGSVLKRGNKTIWPPDICDVYTDREARELMKSDVTVGGVIEDVISGPVYRPLIEALGDAAHGDPHSFAFESWPYDWRRDLADTCDRLDATLAAYPAADEIVLIAHSMGGLIVRGCLEAVRPKPAWLDRVRLAVFLATPHRGATKATATILGLEAVSGLTKRQSAMLNGDARYPSGYELLPDDDDPVFWSGADHRPAMLATDATWSDAGLDLAFKPTIAAFRRRLDPLRRPAQCRYAAVVSAAHGTLVRMDRPSGHGPFKPQQDKISGDGTVPIDSATALHCQTLFVTGSHVGVTQSAKTLAFLIDLIGLPPHFAAAHRARAASVPTLSIAPQFAQVGDTIEIVVKSANGAPLKGQVKVAAMVKGKPSGDIVAIPVKAEGAAIEAITFYAPPLEPGEYLRATSLGAASPRTRSSSSSARLTPLKRAAARSSPHQ